MSEDEIKVALSIEITSTSDLCGTESYVVSLLWNDEAISKGEVEINA